MLYPAAVLYSLGAMLGLAALIILCLPGSVSVLMVDLVDGGVVDASAIATWTVINIGLLIVGTVCAACMAVCMLMERRGKGDGLDLMHNACRVLLVLVKAGGVIALIVMVWRLGRYLLNCEWADTGIYDAYGLLLAEGIMIAQAVGMFCLLLRFLNRACDTAASMAYTRASGKLDDRSIPGFCANGVLLLTAVNGYLAWDWLASLRVEDQLRIVMATHPMMVLAGCMFACAAVANLLIGIFLKQYKRTTEYLLFCPVRESK